MTSGFRCANHSDVPARATCSGGSSGLINAWQAFNLAALLLIIPSHLPELLPSLSRFSLTLTMIAVGLGGLIGARVVHTIRWSE